jgi:hypothetical protein
LIVASDDEMKIKKNYNKNNMKRALELKLSFYPAVKAADSIRLKKKKIVEQELTRCRLDFMSQTASSSNLILFFTHLRSIASGESQIKKLKKQTKKKTLTKAPLDILSSQNT